MSPRRPLPALTLALAVLACGCGTARVRTWSEVEESPPDVRRRIDVVPVVAATQFRATEHRITIEVEGVFEVEGDRRTVEWEVVREHDPWIEAGEMTLGVALAPAIVASVPFYYGIVWPMSGEEGDVVDYLAFLPEVVLDPTENDLFGEETTRIVATRQERYAATRSELLLGDEAARVRLAVDRIRAIGEEDKAYDLPPEAIRIEGLTVILPDPLPGVVSYSMDLRIDGVAHTLRVDAN